MKRVLTVTAFFLLMSLLLAACGSSAPLSDFVPDPISSQFNSIRKDLESGKIIVQPFTGQ